MDIGTYYIDDIKTSRYKLNEIMVSSNKVYTLYYILYYNIFTIQFCYRYVKLECISNISMYNLECNYLILYRCICINFKSLISVIDI